MTPVALRVVKFPTGAETVPVVVEIFPAVDVSPPVAVMRPDEVIVPPVVVVIELGVVSP